MVMAMSFFNWTATQVTGADGSFQVIFEVQYEDIWFKAGVSRAR